MNEQGRPVAMCEPQEPTGVVGGVISAWRGDVYAPVEWHEVPYRDQAQQATVHRSLVSIRRLRPDPQPAYAPRRLTTRPTAAALLGCGRSPREVNRLNQCVTIHPFA